MKNIIKSYLYAIAILATLLVGCTDDSPRMNNETSGGIDGGGNSGQGGSLARFTIANNHLYIITREALFTYSLANESSPVLKNKLPIWTIAETIYSMGDHLFLGTQNGVEILNISNPSAPSRVSTYSHITSCDPVVAKGNYAYATLRTGSTCNRGVNVLDVINIANIKNPKAERSISMENPKGLGLSGDFMYVCDNSKLKTYSLLNPGNPSFMRNLEINGCFDVIALSDRLIVVATEGVYQFAIETNGTLTLLSKINVE